MSARFVVADVFDGLATIPTGSVDLVVTSPPFAWLRSYLPDDHPEKHKEIGHEPTPAAFVDALLEVTAELRRVLAPHGSIAVELGDTYSGSGGAGGDYNENGLREGQPKYRQASPNRAWRLGDDGSVKTDTATRLAEPKNRAERVPFAGGPGFPLAKSKILVPELYRIALAYGINPLTGAESPAGRWRIRNVVTWARPNPPVGALGDKWRPATSDVVVACVSDKRYWDDIATRRPAKTPGGSAWNSTDGPNASRRDNGASNFAHSAATALASAPLLDYWEIPPGGYPGSHYAVFPPALVEPLVKAMCPPKVCRVCGEPSRRIVEKSPEYAEARAAIGDFKGDRGRDAGLNGTDQYHNGHHIEAAEVVTVGWSTCGHDDYRPGVVLDPFAGSGTTLAVATGHGHTAIGIDLDERNEVLARDRIGPLVFDGLLGGQ